MRNVWVEVLNDQNFKLKLILESVNFKNLKGFGFIEIFFECHSINFQLPTFNDYAQALKEPSKIPWQRLEWFQLCICFCARNCTTTEFFFRFRFSCESRSRQTRALGVHARFCYKRLVCWNLEGKKEKIFVSEILFNESLTSITFLVFRRQWTNEKIWKKLFEIFMKVFIEIYLWKSQDFYFFAVWLWWKFVPIFKRSVLLSWDIRALHFILLWSEHDQ